MGEAAGGSAFGFRRGAERDTNGDMKESILLLDGLALVYRAFFAVRGLTGPAGEPTNAVFGFVRMVRQLRSWWKPDRVVAAFDGGSPERRLALCPAYKAQRPPMPDDLRSQLPLVNEYLALAGIPSVRIDRQEADDVLATLAFRAAADGADVRIATGDKDLMQLVDARIRLVAPAKTDQELDEAGVLAKTGVRPDQIVDWLALIGDTADNIPGVPGIGPKTATKLLQRFGTLEACLARAAEIESDHLRGMVQDGAATARTNVGLVELDRSVPGVPEWRDIAAPAENSAGLDGFFVRHGLKKLRKDAAPPAEEPSLFAPTPPPPPPKPQQMSLF